MPGHDESILVTAKSMTSRTATLVGLTAILMWSLLSVLTVATGKIPAFQLAAMTFAIGAAVAFASFLFGAAVDDAGLIFQAACISGSGNSTR